MVLKKRLLHIIFIIVLIAGIVSLVYICGTLITNRATGEVDVEVGDDTNSDDGHNDEELVSEKAAINTDSTEADRDDEQKYENIAGINYPIRKEQGQPVNISIFHLFEGTWVAEGDEKSYFEFYLDDNDIYWFKSSIDSKHSMHDNVQYGCYGIYIMFPVSEGSSSIWYPTVLENETLLEVQCWEGELLTYIYLVVEDCGRYVKIWDKDETEALYFHPVESRESLYKSGTPEFVEVFTKLQGVWVMEDGRSFMEFYHDDNVFHYFGLRYRGDNKIQDYEDIYDNPFVSIYVHDPETDGHAIEGEIHFSITTSYFKSMCCDVENIYIADDGEYLRLSNNDFSESVILYPRDSSVVDNWFEETGYERWY